jgi:hypothetical protein
MIRRDKEKLSEFIIVPRIDVEAAGGQSDGSSSAQDSVG